MLSAAEKSRSHVIPHLGQWKSPRIFFRDSSFTLHSLLSAWHFFRIFAMYFFEYGPFPCLTLSEQPVAPQTFDVLYSLHITIGKKAESPSRSFLFGALACPLRVGPNDPAPQTRTILPLIFRFLLVSL